MKYYNILLALPLLILLTACSGTPEGGSPGPYFSTKQFFNEQADALATEEHTLYRQGTINGVPEWDTIQLVDSMRLWQREFLPFTEGDISKPAMRGAYSVDTLQVEGLVEIRYTALRKKAFTQKLSVWKAGDSVVQLAMATQSRNVVYRSSQQMEYVPFQRYSVSGSQKVMLRKGEEFSRETQIAE